RTTSSTKNGLPSDFRAMRSMRARGKPVDLRRSSTIRVLWSSVRLAGAIGEDEEHPDARHAVHQGGEELLGGAIDPVQVVDDHDLGMARRGRGEETANDVQRLAVALLRAHRGHGQVSRID